MSDAFRKPTASEQKRLDRGRKMVREGSMASDDFLSKLLPTYKYQARNDMKLGQEVLDRVPDKARNYDAYMGMKHLKKGGYVTAADGCVQRGKTRGKMV
jgi:hypothetical protein